MARALPAVGRATTRRGAAAAMSQTRTSLSSLAAQWGGRVASAQVAVGAKQSKALLLSDHSLGGQGIEAAVGTHARQK
jgi:hypothetical protein